MNRPLQEAAVTDPKWARKEQRREWLLKAVTAGVLIALTVGVLTIFQNRGQDRQITKITRTVESPCQTAPAGEQCAAIRRAVALEEPRANPCVSYQRVTGEKGKNCPRFYVRRESQGPSFNATDSGGSKTSTAGGGVNVPTDGDQGGPKQGGVGGQSDGHSKGQKQPPKSSEPSPHANPGGTQADASADISSPGNSEGNGNSESSKANPVAEGAGKAVEDVGAAAGEVVKETGESVNNAVDGVTGKACGLVGASC